ncbi:hypothetical protein J7438_11455 [Thalassotalea sp. G20_0]|uniref:ZmpA/ZmpB/ZmpC family metallo-endopeptidase-related protein n=1 Tax=Thalassotalea sp. G20_0 TaxID=2821093 RepID=UPI001AD9F431|nr:ZmpA/ZmpB/ZmpC family metallo-endopeptidase-related protein [Thalassotalea sp. G20_0]MBO9494704.1 hypothetical protein [Thalassotalea sp. G20_0]
MIQPPTMPGSVTASASQPSTSQSVEPQGRWGRLGVCSESDAVPLLQENTREENPVNDHSAIKNRQQDIPPQHRKPASTTPRTHQLLNPTMVPSAPSGLTAANATATADDNSDRWIAVPDAATLGKIGHDPDYPLNGTYRQTGDIDGSQLGQPIGNDTHPFTGTLRGENGTICNLSHCLVQTLGDEGRIDGLNFNGANIRDKGPVAVVACIIADEAMVSNVSVDNARVVALGDSAGIAGGNVRGTVLNTTAVNCTVAASAGVEDAGAAGIGAGFLRDNGRVVGTTAVNCTSASSEYSGAAGIGAGRLMAGFKAEGRRDGHGMVANTTAVNCKVENSAKYGGAGIGVGTAFNDGTIAHTTALDCLVENTGEYGDAGIGLGKAVFFDMVANTTAVNCTVAASGLRGNAGIGAGGGSFSVANVANTTAANCTVTTSGPGGNAGIGVGMVGGGFESVKIVGTTALNCTVTTSGKSADAGIGEGGFSSYSNLACTTAINCEVDSEYGDAGVMGGPEAGICNVRINGHWQNNTDPGCHPWLDNSGAGIDPGLLPPNYRPDVYNFTALANNQLHQCGFSPATIPTTIPTTTPTISGKSSSRDLNLNQAALAAIALGGVLLVLVVGLCIFRYYRNRASPAAGYSPISAGSTGDNPVNRSPEHSVNSMPDIAEDSDDGELVPLLRLV